MFCRLCWRFIDIVFINIKKKKIIELSCVEVNSVVILFFLCKYDKVLIILVLILCYG